MARLLGQVLVILIILAAGSTALFWYGVSRWNLRLYGRYNRTALARFAGAWQAEISEVGNAPLVGYDFAYSVARESGLSKSEAAAYMKNWLRLRVESVGDRLQRVIVFGPGGNVEAVLRPDVILNYPVFRFSTNLVSPLDSAAARAVRGFPSNLVPVLGWYPMRGDFHFWSLRRHLLDPNVPGVFAFLVRLRGIVPGLERRMFLRAPQGLLLVRNDGVILYCDEERWTNQHVSRLFPQWRRLLEPSQLAEVTLRTSDGEKWLLTGRDYFHGPMRTRVVVYTNLSAFEVSMVRRILLAHVVLTALALAATILVVTTRTRRALGTLSDLMRETDRIAHGHWGGQVKVQGDDEVGRLAENFNRMSRSLVQLLDQVALERGEKRHQQQISEMRATLLQTLGHDLNKLLAAMRSPIENLTSGFYGSIPERAQISLRRALVAVRLMENMVLNILASARIERGRVRLELSRFREHELMDEVRAYAEAMRERWKHGKISIRVEDNASNVPMVADREKLVRVLVNLISNAVESVRRSGVENGEVVVRSAASHFDVLFEVVDNGEGMSAEQAAAWLGQDAENKPATDGLGLGLTIVRTFVELHRGQIEVRGEPGVGTIFRLRIPRVHESRETKSAEEVDMR